MSAPERVAKAAGVSLDSVIVAPGRITLVGDHVDYAGGVTVAGTCNKELAVAFVPSVAGETGWHVWNEGQTEDRGELWTQGTPGDAALAPLILLARRGRMIPSATIYVASDIAPGAGLSSSAALVIAVIVAFYRSRDQSILAEDLIALATDCEHEILGTPCGALDQSTIVRGRSTELCVVDSHEEVVMFSPPLPSSMALVVCTTAISHETRDGRYADLRSDVEKATEMLGVPTLRGLTVDDLAPLATTPRLYCRARHVVTETERALAARRMLREGKDMRALGGLMTASHYSLASDFGVSTATLDLVVEAARRLPECYGARMMGAGMGGSVIALVEEAVADRCIIAMRAAALVPKEMAFRVELTDGMNRRYRGAVMG